MKTAVLTIIPLVLFTCLQAARAFSPIGDVDGWDADRLAKAGITVAPWKHDRIGEDPPLDWVQVTFDCSQRPEDWDVLMTLWVISSGKTVSASRAERTKGGGNKLTLLFAVQQEYRDNSRIEIVILKPLSHDEKPLSHDENPMFGYRLSLKRIIELAHQKTANNDLEGEEN